MADIGKPIEVWECPAPVEIPTPIEIPDGVPEEWETDIPAPDAEPVPA